MIAWQKINFAITCDINALILVRKTLAEISGLSRDLSSKKLDAFILSKFGLQIVTGSLSGLPTQLEAVVVSCIFWRIYWSIAILYSHSTNNRPARTYSDLFSMISGLPSCSHNEMLFLHGKRLLLMSTKWRKFLHFGRTIMITTYCLSSLPPRWSI